VELKPVIIIVIAFVLLIPIPIFAQENNDYQLDVTMILISLDCSVSIHGDELHGLLEIAYRYLTSFQFPTEIHAYCVTPDQFDDVWNFLDLTYDEIVVVMFDLDEGLWTETSFEMFDYTSPDDLNVVQGTIFFEDRLILMSYSLKDDMNSPILTHELMHFVLENMGFGHDVYINQVHEDWAVYKNEYEQKEKLWSDIANKYYYIFG